MVNQFKRVILLKKLVLFTLLVFIIVLYTSCTYAENTAMAGITEIALKYFSEKTELPISVLDKIAYIKTYDCVSDWYIALCYSEPIETNSADNYNESIILLSIYLCKANNAICDAQNNTKESLFQSIYQYYKKRVTYNRYLQLNQSWEKLFGPVIYWQYDTTAAFELLYHIRPNTDYMKNTNLSLDDNVSILDKPEAVFPKNNTINFQNALSIAKQSLSEKYGLDQGIIESLEYGSILKENDMPAQRFNQTNRISNVYWIITFYSNGVRCYACQILEDGSVEQIIRFSQNGKGIIYDDGVFE